MTLKKRADGGVSVATGVFQDITGLLKSLKERGEARREETKGGSQETTGNGRSPGAADAGVPVSIANQWLIGETPLHGVVGGEHFSEK